jgi:hypothetical protein
MSDAFPPTQRPIHARDRYLRVAIWAAKRYRNPVTGALLIRGKGLDTPSRYTRIEDLAAVRYLGHAERWTGFPLNACPEQ